MPEFLLFLCPSFLSFFFPQEASFKLVVNSFVKRLENTRVKNLLAPIKVKGFLNCIVAIEVATRERSVLCTSPAGFYDADWNTLEDVGEVEDVCNKLFFCPYISTFAAAFDISFLVFSIFKSNFYLNLVSSLYFFKVICVSFEFFCPPWILIVNSSLFFCPPIFHWNFPPFPIFPLLSLLLFD